MDRVKRSLSFADVIHGGSLREQRKERKTLGRGSVIMIMYELHTIGASVIQTCLNEKVGSRIDTTMAASQSEIESYYVGEKYTEDSEGNARSSTIAGNTNAEISAAVICFPDGSLST